MVPNPNATPTNYNMGFGQQFNNPMNNYNEGYPDQDNVDGYINGEDEQM